LRCERRERAATVQHRFETAQASRVDNHVRLDTAAAEHSAPTVRFECRPLRRRQVVECFRKRRILQWALNGTATRGVIKSGCNRESGAIGKAHDALHKTFAVAWLANY